MGEALYNATIKYSTNESLSFGISFVNNFIDEGIKAYNFWQDNRSHKNFDFWNNFKEQFPLISEYLKYANLFGTDYNNNLAGYLDFTKDNFDVDFNNLEIHFGGMVWHFANWNPILNFIKLKTNSVSENWNSIE